MKWSPTYSFSKSESGCSLAPLYIVTDPLSLLISPALCPLRMPLASGLLVNDAMGRLELTYFTSPLNPAHAPRNV
jgi:hypothetical protein